MQLLATIPNLCLLNWLNAQLKIQLAEIQLEEQRLKVEIRRLKAALTSTQTNRSDR